MDARLGRVIADPGAAQASSLWSDLGAHARSDPAGFQDKVSWWRDALFSALRAGALPSPASTAFSTCSSAPSAGSASASAASGLPSSSPSSRPAQRLVLHVDETLRRVWTRSDVGRPLGLGAVVQRLASQNELYPYHAFISSLAPLQLHQGGKGRQGSALADGRSLARRAAGAAGGMAASATVAALTAALGALGLGGDNAGDEDTDPSWSSSQGDWVAVPLLSNAAKEIQDAHYARAGISPLDVLYTKEEVARLLIEPTLSRWVPELFRGASTPSLSQEDFNLLLLHLSRDVRAIAVKDDVVKFAVRAGEQASPVTKHEQDVVQVRLTHSLLEKQVTSLQLQVDACTQRAKKAMGSKLTSVARTHLKTRKALLDLLDKRTTAEHNLATVLLKLDQVSTDAKLADTYENASAALAHVLSDPRLQLDRVESTMDQLHEGIQSAQAVSDAISASGHEAGEADEDEIAAELAALEKETQPEPSKEPKPEPAPQTTVPQPTWPTNASDVEDEKHKATASDDATGQPATSTSETGKTSTGPLPELPSVPPLAPGQQSASQAATPLQSS